jgi:hypothetical protein
VVAGFVQGGPVTVVGPACPGVPSRLDRVDARLPLSAVAALAVGSLVSCGSPDRPVVCGSVDDLTASAGALRSTTLTSAAGARALTTVGTDLQAVESDATTQLSAQVAAVEAAYTALASSTAIAKARPTPASLAASAKDLSTFGSTVRTLAADVRSTC